MMLTLTLAVGLLVAPEPQAEPQKGRGMEIHGCTYHPKQAAQPKGKEWTIEIGCHTDRLRQPRMEFILEFQWPIARLQREPVEAQYYNDLSAFFKQQSQVQVQVEAIKGFYIDDLPAHFKQLKKR